jgi:hypothetical protein
MEESVKKKRGRKPKTYIDNDTVVLQQEKKKRGRKKKYELENFEKILHRESENNFNHNIIYSDDESVPLEENCVKKISFGNLDITVSKKIETETVSDFKLKTRMTINQDEYSSDEEKQIPVESFMDINYYTETKRYIPKVISECTNSVESVKKIKVVKTTLGQVSDSGLWPETCDTCCWWCCHPFEGSPCTLPTKYDPLRKRFTFCGLFCSWSCVKAYNFERSDHKKYYCSSLISLLVQQIYGVRQAIGIKPAPPRQTLKMFGGYLEIDEFRSPSDIDGYQINLVKFNYIHPEITEIRNVKSKPEKKVLRLCRPG